MLQHYVYLVGAEGCGKSAFCNELLGAAFMPSGRNSDRLTAVPVQIVKNNCAQYSVDLVWKNVPVPVHNFNTTFLCSTANEIQIALRNVFEQLKDEFWNAVNHIRVVGPFTALPDNVVLVDMPGWTDNSQVNERMLFSSGVLKTLVYVSARALNPVQFKQWLVRPNDYGSAVYSLAAPVNLASAYLSEPFVSAEETRAFEVQRRQELVAAAEQMGVQGALKLRLACGLYSMPFCGRGDPQLVQQFLNYVHLVAVSEHQQQFEHQVEDVNVDALQADIEVMFSDECVKLLQRTETLNAMRKDEAIAQIQKALSKTLFEVDVKIAGAIAGLGTVAVPLLHFMSAPAQRVHMLWALCCQVHTCTTWTRGLNTADMRELLRNGGDENSVIPLEQAVPAISALGRALTDPLRYYSTAN